MTDEMKGRKAGGEEVGMEIEIFFPLLVIYFDSRLSHLPY